MDGFMKALIEELPGWSFQVFAVVIIAGLIFYFYKTFYLNKKFNDLVGDVLKKDDRVQALQDKIDFLSYENFKYKNDSSQLFSCIINLKRYIEVLNDIRATDDAKEIMSETHRLMQRVIESLAFDIKALSGEQHRCGIWSKDNNDLLLVISSSGFPSHYIGQRRLDINRSIAGRCFRKSQSINCPDITKDEDWKPNDQSRSMYKSLICIPLGTWGVITIDALEPLGENSLLIGEIYSSILFGIMLEYYKAARYFEETEEEDEEVS